jgi:hypothetical protein
MANGIELGHERRKASDETTNERSVQDRASFFNIPNWGVLVGPYVQLARCYLLRGIECGMARSVAGTS